MSHFPTTSRLARRVGLLSRGFAVIFAALGFIGHSSAQSVPPLLSWDPGTAPEGTVFVEQTTAAADAVYRVRSQNPASGAWRTVLQITAGNADLYMKRGTPPDPANAAAVDFKSTRPTGHEGILLNPAGQFAVGEDYFILVRSSAGASWRLLSGDVYIENLGSLTFTDTNGNGKFDSTEAVIPQAAPPRRIGGEGMVFYRATVPEGVPAWSLWLNGLTNKLAVRKNFVPFQTDTMIAYDVEKASRALLVPDYLQASTAGSAYFISVAGNPGTEVKLDSRIQSFTEIDFESTTTVTGSGAGYRTFRVSVPPNQLAWSVSVTPQTGDANVCLRRDKIGSEDENNGYSEVNSTTVADSITLSPASSGSLQDGLTDGTFFLTLYSTDGTYSATLRSGSIQVTDIPFVSTTVNDAPERAGWRFYRVPDIASQNGLGWELLLSDQAANTEIAIRRNAVPSRWMFRTGGSSQQSSGILNLSSTTGLLQNPRHQRDVWYVGIYQPTLPLGAFSLESRPMTAGSLNFTSDSQPVAQLLAGRNYYWQVTVPPAAKGWKLDITRLAAAGAAGGDGDCYFAIARDVLPSLQDTGEMNMPATVGFTDNAWPSSRQMKIDRSRDLVPVDKDGDQTRRYSVILPMGHPLEPGTYFLGIRAKSSTNLKLDLASRGIGEGPSWPVSIGTMNITGAGAVKTLPDLALGEVAFFKTAVPAGMHTWELTLDAPAGDALFAVQRGLIPGTSAAETSTILRTNTSTTTIPGAVLVRRAAADRLVLMEGSGQTELPPGDYYVAVQSQGKTGAAGQPMEPVSPVLRSLGELPVTSMGTVGVGNVTVPFSLAAAQIGAWEFTLPEGLPAMELSVESTTGNAVAALWAGPAPRFAQPARETERYGYEGGEPDSTSPAGIKLRLTNPTRQVLVNPNPAAGVYRVMLRAAIKTGSAYEPATGFLTIRGIGVQDVAFDAGTATVTGQVEESWRFFGVDVPPTTSLLGWDIRVENIKAEGGGTLSSSPDVIIRRDLPPVGGTAVSGGSLDWKSGDYYTVRTDWTALDTNPGGSRQAGAVLPMGKPLKPGRYVVGIKAKGASIGYTFRTRGIGDSFSIPVNPLPVSADASNRVVITDLAFREAAYFKLDFTASAPANFLTIADALSGTADFRLALRRGGLPGVSASSSSDLAGAHGVLCAKSESGAAPLEEELYIALPPSAQSTLPAGTYYVAVISEGNSGAADPDNNKISVGIGCASPIPIENLGTVPPDEEAFVVRPYSLRAGAIAVYEANIAPNLYGRSASIEPGTGISALSGNSGVTDRLPRPFNSAGYGVEGGDTTGGYVAAVISTGLCQDIPNGISRFVVRAMPAASGAWGPATGLFYIGGCTIFPVLPLDSEEPVCGSVPATSWVHYRVTIPPNITGWDLRCASSKAVDMMIRRSMPADSTTATVTHSSASWPAQGSWAVSSDWTRLSQNSEGNAFLWSVIPMGQPLEAGTYYVSLRNTTTTATSFCIQSRAIGDGRSISVEPLPFSGATAVSSALPMPAKTARYFKVAVPSGVRAWEFESQVTNGDVVLAVRKDRIPGSKADNSTQGPYQFHGLTLDKAGHERMALIPQDGQEFLTAGDYYIAMISKGTGVSGSRTGAQPADAVLHSSGTMPVQALGVVTAQQPANVSLTFGEAQIMAFEFEIAAATPGVEVRLDDRAGLPRLALWTGDPKFLPEPPGTSPIYGFWGGSKTNATGTRYEQDSIYTMANVVAGRYRLVLRACPSGNIFPAASCRLSVSIKPNIPIAFGPLLETPGLSSRHQAQLVKGQKNLYSVNVPAAYNGQDVLGWLLYARQLSGTTGLRAFRLGTANSEIAVTGQNSLLLAPPFFTAGQTWYFSVDGEGLAEYEVESRPVQLAQAPWVLPLAFNQTFGDSAPSAQEPESPLAQDDWHFYAINIPNNNVGGLRTMLESISGNPDLYIRAGAIPTSDHKLTGTSGSDLFDRRLNGTTTEYGNWVPEKGRSETQLAPATWYLGVKAATARNASYRLRASSPTVTTLQPNGGSVANDTVAGGDWRYYYFAPPAGAPATWKLTFNRTLGNASLYIRDTVPPGDFSGTGSVKFDYSDSKNSGSYQTGGYSQPGVITYTSPNLRAGHKYWVGVRALSDSQFSLSSTTEGALSAIPVLSLADGTFNESMAPGETRLFRVVAPQGSTRIGANYNGTGGTMELRVEQASPPGTTGTSHSRTTGGAFSQALSTDANNQWPWISGYDFYFRLTNTGTVARTPALVLNGALPVSPDTDSDGLLDSWERTHFNNALTAGALEDTDKDGRVNLLEFALGSSPVNAVNPGQPIKVSLDSGGRLVMEITRPPGVDLSVIQYSVEFSSDLVTWSSAPGVVLRDTAAVYEVRDTSATTNTVKRHVRLKVKRAGMP